MPRVSKEKMMYCVKCQTHQGDEKVCPFCGVHSTVEVDQDMLGTVPATELRPGDWFRYARGEALYQVLTNEAPSITRTGRLIAAAKTGRTFKLNTQANVYVYDVRIMARAKRQ